MILKLMDLVRPPDLNINSILWNFPNLGAILSKYFFYDCMQLIWLNSASSPKKLLMKSNFYKNIILHYATVWQVIGGTD